MMISSWKDSFYLAILEFRTQFGYIVFGWFVILIVGALFLSSFYNYLQNNHPAFDLMFIAYFFAFPYWMRSRQMLIQKINQQHYASPFFLLLAQLPVNKRSIIRSRIIAYYLFSIPILGVTFLALFVFDARLYKIFNFGTYLIFFTVWIAFSAWFGIALVAAEAGTKNYMWQSLIGLFIVTSIFIFHHYLQMGVIAWTVHMVHTYPFQTFATSIFIFLTGWQSWQFIMKKRFTSVDYL